jgi:hypothetical protein
MSLGCRRPCSTAPPTLLSSAGKTTTASQLATLAGARLVVFNLSQQTDSSDLLGGFRPVEPQDALLPLLEPFLSLMRRTWTRWGGWCSLMWWPGCVAGLMHGCLCWLFDCASCVWWWPPQQDACTALFHEHDIRQPSCHLHGSISPGESPLTSSPAGPPSLPPHTPSH